MTRRSTGPSWMGATLLAVGTALTACGAAPEKEPAAIVAPAADEEAVPEAAGAEGESATGEEAAESPDGELEGEDPVAVGGYAEGQEKAPEEGEQGVADEDDDG